MGSGGVRIMRYFYIKTIENIAIEGIETFAPIDDSDLIEVTYLPIDFLFKKYLNGEWTTPEPEPTPEEPSE
jgi:hypothetical protein